MNFISKKLLGGLLLTSIIPATLLLTSCSTAVEEHFENGITEDTEKYYGEKITEHSFSTPEKVIRKTMLITAGGLVNDKSFNQSVWEAMLLYKKQAGITDKETITYRTTAEDVMLASMYDQALAGGYKTWVLTGFQQAPLFESWLKESNNREAFIQSKAVVVGVDWDASAYVPAGQFLGLGFKTEEPSWVVGYAASKFLSTTDKPYLSSFGGGIFDGVTDFNNGFLQGMLDWNTDNSLKKVKFYSGNSQVEAINLETGFAATPEAIETIQSIVGNGENTPQIILPVAGGLISSTIDDIKNKNSSQMVIGTDTNQAIAFPQDKEMFFSSIEKKVAMAVYKTVVMLAGIPLDYKTEKSTDIGFQSESVELKTNAYVKYGFDKGFVGYSTSSLIGSEASKANTCLENSYNIFVANKPKFQSMINSGENNKLLNGIIKAINS